MTLQGADAILSFTGKAAYDFKARVSAYLKSDRTPVEASASPLFKVLNY